MLAGSHFFTAKSAEFSRGERKGKTFVHISLSSSLRVFLQASNYYVRTKIVANIKTVPSSSVSVKRSLHGTAGK